MSRLWDKGLPLDERVLHYTAGEDHRLDARLVHYDIRASAAHARMLSGCGYLAAEDCEQICEGLAQLGRQFDQGEWTISLQDEDVHTALESRLTALIGEAGGRVHLGRSRNDQVLTALRLYLLDACDAMQAAMGELGKQLEDLKSRFPDQPLPGYTHMQRAMPSSVALWANAYLEAAEDAVEGIEAAKRRLDKNPLGSAAGYGAAGLSLDRQATTDELGFSRVQEPVTAVQLSRGKAEAGLLFEITLLLTDLGRMASDLLLFYTQEFAFVSLADDVTTGSSIMPQKRNPDVLELIRASSATAQACLDECLMVTAKLPSGYQRDLQRIKAPTFRGIDLAVDSIDVMTYLLSGLVFRPENIEMDESLDAAERANRLVTDEGLSFREAYRRVASHYAGS